LEEKDHQIETIIRERTSAQHAEKQELLDKKGTNVAEIAELLAQIDHLRGQDQYNTLPGALDKEIAAAHACYKLDLEKIQLERTQFLKNKARLESEQEEINRDFEDANKKLAELRFACEKQEQLLDSIEKSIAHSREIIKVFDQKVMESHEIHLAEEHALEEELTEQSDLKGLKQKFTASEDYIKELTSEILQIKLEIRNLEHNMITAQNITLPNMDSEKKTCRKEKGLQRCPNSPK